MGLRDGGNWGRGPDPAHSAQNRTRQAWTLDFQRTVHSDPGILDRTSTTPYSPRVD